MAVPIAMTQEQQALQASLRDWAKRAGPLAVVRAMEPGQRHELPPAGAALLSELAALGVFAMPALSIAGGTTQILLNQVAERVLGLPR
jgi:alkylation response protein AidB-like acyl-CoA dehydrogenase